MKMNAIKWTDRTSILCIAALGLGIVLHELFSFCPTIVTEFFSAVNESIWEHVKIVFWPLLFLVPVSVGKEKRTEALTAPLVSSLVMLFLGWLYHIQLGGRLLVVDLLIFALVIVLGFVLPKAVSLPQGAGSVVTGLLILFIALILAFTVTPPHGMLFKDASLVDAWVRMPC